MYHNICRHIKKSTIYIYIYKYGLENEHSLNLDSLNKRMKYSLLSYVTVD